MQLPVSVSESIKCTFSRCLHPCCAQMVLGDNTGGVIVSTSVWGPALFFCVAGLFLWEAGLKLKSSCQRPQNINFWRRNQQRTKPDNTERKPGKMVNAHQADFLGFLSFPVSTTQETRMGSHNSVSQTKTFVQWMTVPADKIKTFEQTRKNATWKKRLRFTAVYRWWHVMLSSSLRFKQTGTEFWRSVWQKSKRLRFTAVYGVARCYRAQTYQYGTQTLIMPLAWSLLSRQWSLRNGPKSWRGRSGDMFL